jgi:cytochrome c553
VKSSVTFVFAAALALSAIVLAQETSKTVTAGVYTDAQADRGALSYDAACASCHRADLGGNSAPALKEQRFNRTYAGKDLKALFTKIETTMPRNAAAGSLGENVYLDIIAHVLKENGFPAGTSELTADSLEGVQIVPGKPKPPPPLSDFSYVDVVGCLTAGPDNTWLLTRAGEPVVAVPVMPTAPGAAAVDSLPMAPLPKTLGSGTFRLLDAMAYAPDAHKNHKMHVRGLLIKLPFEQRMTISSLDMVAPACTE